MSRFLLLNFKDFGLSQDITQTIQSQTLVCICCLDSNLPLISLSTCKHEYYLESFYKSVSEPSRKLVCSSCHNMLKKIEVFRQQVMKSLRCLEAEEKNCTPQLNKLNLTTKNVVNIYLPPTKYVPERRPLTKAVEPQIKKQSVKNEPESVEPGLPVVKIKAEPADSEKVHVEIEIEPSVLEISPEPQPPEKVETLSVRTVTLQKEELMLERLKQAQSPSYLKFPYRCQSCVMGFNYEENIKDHIKRKHGPKVGSVTCDICLAVLYPPGSINAHMFRHLTRYECTKCNQRYSTYDDALHHYKKVHGENSTHKCSDCLYSTDSPQMLRKHKLLHQKRFTCKDCGVVLATRPSLTRHMAVLHNKRIYKCVHCGSVHSDGATFVAHMRRHGAAAARAACAPCGLQFKAWHAYNAHVLFSAAHNNRNKISCSHCGMKFATATHLRMHVQFSDHPKQTFYCPECPKVSLVEPTRGSINFLV
ncbi:hypothetical protein MSG28_015899 [Choristoneura fumiferana]|uniref:Uncharacterized protein n=1 Tax=Choristoneura fumiferana TaxID=7141 RepID=A0ACC0K576_CHOFU|nr:hypothetical protein MSG28_015899 [Choristoneura fumiferana]